MEACGCLFCEVRTLLFFTSALDADEWSAKRPDRFTPGNESSYALDRLGETQNQFGQCGVENKLALPRTEYWAAQPVICHYTN
jgi:hypothetical protein